VSPDLSQAALVHGKPKLVIFDCDGVLVDSEPHSITVLTELMQELGLSLTRKDCYDLFLGRSMASLNAILSDKFGKTVSADQLKAMRHRLFELHRRELQPIQGIAEAIESLKVPYCVASSSQPERIRISLEITGLASYFGDRVFSATMVAHGKPAPDLFLYAAKQMGTAPEHCIVIEDSPAGIEAAKSAFMRPFAFVGGSHASDARLRETVEALQPFCIFEDMAELPSLIDRLG
jgi:HAD superfamily hydrolase (TIGR01509 family)